MASQVMSEQGEEKTQDIASQSPGPKQRVRLSKADVENRRLRVAERVLFGVSPAEIAREIGWTDAGVRKDIDVIVKRWMDQANDLIERKKARQDAELNRLARKLNEYLAKSEAENDGQGNARYVELLQGIWDRRSKLYGLAQEGSGQASSVTVVAGIDLAAVLGQRPMVDMGQQAQITQTPSVFEGSTVTPVTVHSDDDENDDDCEEPEETPKPKRVKPDKIIKPTYSERLGLPSVFDGLKPKAKRSPNHPANNEPAPPPPAPAPIPYSQYSEPFTLTPEHTVDPSTMPLPD